MDQEQVINLGVNALKGAYHIQRKLLGEGTIGDFVKFGRGNDKATKGDWESEGAVINYLRDKGFPGKIIAEEYGEIDLGDRYLAILDGIDGSSALVNNPNTRCGTILTFADNLSPKYEDFFFSGMTEYVTNRIAYGIRDGGVWLIEKVGGDEIERLLPKFQDKPFSEDRRIKIDCYKVDYAPGITSGMNQFEEFMAGRIVSKLDGKMQLSGSVTGSEMCLDLLEGKVDAVAHVVAKGVFEPPAMYLLTTELGGVGTDLEGNDLGNRKWGPMSIYEDGRMEVDGNIFASSPAIGNAITDLLRMII